MAALQLPQFPIKKRHFVIQATSSPNTTHVANYHMALNSSNFNALTPDS
jgi:hypothetical protein